MLYSRAAVLFGIETTQGVAQSVTAANDALLVDEPDYKADVQIIDRNFSKGDLSPFPHMVGRQLGQITFKHEIRSNGKFTGLTADAPRIARLFRACGFALSACSTAADRIADVIPELTNGNNPTAWTPAGTPTNTEAGVFDLVVTTGGLAAAAKVTVTCNNSDLQAAPATNVAVNAAIALGNTGLTVLPVLGTSWVVGDRWRIVVLPAGVKLTPVTSGFETATIEAYFDGLRHRLLGAMGTFQFSVDAGGVAVAEFTFMGVHQPVIDAAFPTGLVFEETLPPLFQDANLTWGSNSSLVVGSMSFDLAAQNAVRDDANAVSGYRGYQPQSRAPAGGFTPETVLEASNPFWADLTAGTQKLFFARIGGTQGNSMVMYGPRTQTSTLGYTNKNNDRVYDVGMAFKRFRGDDEVRFFFG